MTYPLNHHNRRWFQLVEEGRGYFPRSHEPGPPCSWVENLRGSSPKEENLAPSLKTKKRRDFDSLCPSKSLRVCDSIPMTSTLQGICWLSPPFSVEEAIVSIAKGEGVKKTFRDFWS
ncbi:unnamed protein product [Lupinus luteus]|uniref:Uncharacterized protein n=1 Tax=Lupinus luteus TaxID=3873 RepID=A0AAV1XZ15_LUPLU